MAKATKNRVEREKFRANMVVNYAEHLFPATGPEDKSKNPLLKHYYFVNTGAQVNARCYSSIGSAAMDRIVGLLSIEYQSSPFLPPLKEEIASVSSELTFGRMIGHDQVQFCVK